jgi:hypothetical protein
MIRSVRNGALDYWYITNQSARPTHFHLRQRSVLGEGTCNCKYIAAFTVVGKDVAMMMMMMIFFAMHICFPFISDFHMAIVWKTRPEPVTKPWQWRELLHVLECLMQWLELRFWPFTYHRDPGLLLLQLLLLAEDS